MNEYRLLLLKKNMVVNNSEINGKDRTINYHPNFSSITFH